MAENVFQVVAPLEPRQERFVQEYIIDLNGTQAAIRAGYSEASATSTASSLLSKPNVKEAVQRALAQRASRVQMTQETVLHEMSLLSNSRIDHYIIDDHGQVQLAEGAPEGAMAAIQSIKRRTNTRTDKEGNTFTTYEVEIRLWDKPTPLKLMGRHTGLFPDRMEHTGKGGEPIKTVTEIRRIIVKPGEQTKE